MDLKTCQNDVKLAGKHPTSFTHNDISEVVDKTPITVCAQPINGQLTKPSYIHNVVVPMAELKKMKAEDVAE